MTAMPAWLRQVLIDQGKISGDGFSIQARAGICHHCGATVIRGLVAGMPTTLDVQALDDPDELAALLDGRRTARVVWQWDHYEAGWRTPWHIRGSPAGQVRDVHAEHSCGRPLGTLRDPSRPVRAKPALPAIPPF